MACSSNVYISHYGEVSKSIPKKPSCPPHYPQVSWQLQILRKSWKQNWPRRARDSEQRRKTLNSFLCTQFGPWKCTGRFVEYLLYLTAHPEFASSNVSAEDNNNESGRTIILWSKSCLLSILYGQLDVWFWFLCRIIFLWLFFFLTSQDGQNIQDICTSDRKIPEAFQQNELHTRKISFCFAVNSTGVGWSLLL